jgi:50S ribosomal subunit-associated GTPase HflX
LRDLKLADKNVLLALNKIDSVKDTETLKRLGDRMQEFASVIPISATTGQGIETLLKEISSTLAL